MVGWILATMLFLLVLYLLFVPLDLYLNTDTGSYYLQLKGLAKASVEGDERELLKIRLDALFSHFYFYPLKPNKGEKKAGKAKKGHQKRKSFLPAKAKLKRYARVGRKLIPSFELKQLELSIDTGDCVQNARLFPAFAFLNRYVGDFDINFQDRNRLVLHVKNRPIRIIKAFINP